MKRECYWVLFGVLMLLGATRSVGAAGRYLERRCCRCYLGRARCGGAASALGWIEKGRLGARCAQAELVGVGLLLLSG